jgi:hypothetical protein
LSVSSHVNSIEAPYTLNSIQGTTILTRGVGALSVPPEKLLRAMLLQVFYTSRWERQLKEQTHYNLLFRLFIGLSVDDPVRVPTVFTTNRYRLIEHKTGIGLFNEVISIANVNGWRSGEHFSRGRHADLGLGWTQELSRQGRW